MCLSKWIARVLCVKVLLTLISIQPVRASDLPTSAAEPTGCSHDPFNLGVEAGAAWGVVPFSTSFEAVISGGYDSIDSTSWDLNGDGLADTTCNSISPIFNDPGDYTISAWIATRSHGVLRRDVTVSAYSAVMTLTFDDGHRSLVTDAMPLFQSKGITGTAYIVPGWVDSTQYVTWEELAILQASGWDIGSHTMTHCRLSEVDDSTLHYELRESRVELQSRGFSAKHFAAPHDDCDARVVDAVRLYYDSNRTQEGLNLAAYSADPYSLRSQMSISWRSLEWYLTHIDSVVAAGGWYILNNHLLCGKCGTYPWCITRQMMSDIIDYAVQNRGKGANLDETLAALGEDQAARLLNRQKRTSAPDSVPSTPAGQVSCWAVPDGSGVRVTYQVSRQTQVSLSLFSLQGQYVKTLADRYHRAGTHTLLWDCAGDSGRRVSPGVYFFRLIAGEERATGKIVLPR